MANHKNKLQEESKLQEEPVMSVAHISELGRTVESHEDLAKMAASEKLPIPRPK